MTLICADFLPTDLSAEQSGYTDCVRVLRSKFCVDYSASQTRNS